MTAFGERLRSAISTHGRLCVGIDPHETLLDAWGLGRDAAGLRAFGLRVVEAAAGRVPVVKPQVAFFERHGSAGIAALEDVMSAARQAGLLVLADAKRGDIGTTMDAYAAAWLSPGSPLEADAVTVSPYLGIGALEGTFRLAQESGKGVFVLAATSNPEARALQGADVGDETVAGHVLAEVEAYNAATTGDAWGDIGLVIGATVDRTAAGLGSGAFEVPTPVLAPGFGAQGARLGDLDRLFGPVAPQVLASASRSILGAGPDGVPDAIDAHNHELEESLHG